MSGEQWSQPNQQVVRDGEPVAAGENDGTAPGPEPIPATGATAGAPGTFTPAGCETPADVAAMSGLTATPAALWDEGQYVSTLSGDAYYDGAAFVAGQAPPPVIEEDAPTTSKAKRA